MMTLSQKRKYIADNLLNGIYFKIDQIPYPVLATKIKNSGLMVFCNNKWLTVRVNEHLTDKQGNTLFPE